MTIPIYSTRSNEFSISHTITIELLILNLIIHSVLMKSRPDNKKGSKKRLNNPSNEEASADGKKPKLDIMSEVG